jgi:hypothetical protein
LPLLGSKFMSQTRANEIAESITVHAQSEKEKIRLQLQETAIKIKMLLYTIIVANIYYFCDIINM